MTPVLLGTVVRLQVQQRPLKPGVAPDRVYDPSPLLPVPAVWAEPAGVHGLLDDGSRVLDAHHVDHPDSRDRRGRAGLSFMTTGDYARLRARFGPHLPDGVAGEGVLLDGVRPVEGSDLLVETAEGGLLRVTGVRVAAPCVEFSRFCLGLPPGAPVDDTVRAAMAFLDDGGRGFRAAAAGTGTVRVGARVWASVGVPAPRRTAGQRPHEDDPAAPVA